jgi:hypothetical protein
LQIDGAKRLNFGRKTMKGQQTDKPGEVIEWSLSSRPRSNEPSGSSQSGDLLQMNRLDRYCGRNENFVRVAGASRDIKGEALG